MLFNNVCVHDNEKADTKSPLRFTKVPAEPQQT